jgi:hypothetical protein
MLVAVPVSSRNTSRAGSMRRCQLCQRRRLAATSGRSCSAALSVFLAPQPEPVERVVKGREPGDDPDAACNSALSSASVMWGRLNQPSKKRAAEKEG